MYESGGPVRKPYARVNFIPPVRDYEFGYCTGNVVGGGGGGRDRDVIRSRNNGLHRPLLELLVRKTCVPNKCILVQFYRMWWRLGGEESWRSVL
jgi:hypothetical protein